MIHSIFKGKHIIITKIPFMDSYMDKERIDRWEVFLEQDLISKLCQGEFIKINDEELCIEKVINNLDGSVEYKVNKILSKKKY